MEGKKVAIIGGGLSGLTTLKQCLADGLSPILFEGRDGLGGQWRYEEPDPETGHATSSIYQGVILNSCRDTSTFSDFPIDTAKYPDYFSHRGMLEYIESYADHFGLRDYIRLGTKVISCTQLADSRWEVAYQPNGEFEEKTVYDAIFACTGHNTRPSTPEFEGMKSFKGELLHSHLYRKPEQFAGKKVALIGFGSSAVDLASELVHTAKEVHMVTRRGGWIIPRFVLGQAVEAYDNRITETLLPARFSQWCQAKILNLAQGEHPEAIKPEHKLFEANPTVHSLIVEHIRTDRIKAHRAGVERFTETSLVLTNGTALNVDVVICCTGYHIDFPYLPAETWHVQNNPILKSSNTMDLYQLVASPRFSNIFFIGFIELPGPLIPVAEVQARWATGILTGRVELPSVDEMNEWVKKFQEGLAKSMVPSDRHTLAVHYLPYCDSLLSSLGATPTFPRLFSQLFTSNPFRAFSILKAVYFGMNSPAQYRLFGHGAKPELASETLMRLSGGEKGLSGREKELMASDVSASGVDGDK
ncbi:hypothetical protein FQN55_001984 [Onygenales sp. PD_40]|nr:hypothetical protein FQN55_001984 [Onygenales sp. PD_40]